MIAYFLNGYEMLKRTFGKTPKKWKKLFSEITIVLIPV